MKYNNKTIAKKELTENFSSSRSNGGGRGGGGGMNSTCKEKKRKTATEIKQYEVYIYIPLTNNIKNVLTCSHLV